LIQTFDAGQEPSMSLAIPSVRQRAVLRAMAWALIGVIYAPLFVILHGLLEPRFDGAAYTAAAAVAGGVGAAFYGARHVALAASLIGAVSALFMLVLFDGDAVLWHLAVLAGMIGLLTGLAVDFPSRCTTNVLAKVLAGGLTGALCGAFVTGASSLAGLTLSMAAVVAFLVSVNGVIYVASVRYVSRATAAIPGRFCGLTEGAIIAIIAVIVAGSVWGFAGTLMEGRTDLLAEVMNDAAVRMPALVAAGCVAGGITGALLELFDFDWIDDL
jgi:hypothetical protein